MCNRFLVITLSVSMMMGTSGWSIVGAAASTPTQEASTSDQQVMDKLLAPIALYPDALLAQVLACTGSPQQVTEINQWLEQNNQLEGTELQQAAELAGFDASFISMVLFPDVLMFLEQNLEWATEVGNAFSSDQEAVLDSVQRLRAQAIDVGNLQTTPQQEVITETQNGQTVIVVQPANPQVVYVPQYNPQTVYTAPPPAEDNSGDVAAAALIGFALGVALGAAIDDDYGYYGYHGYGAWGMHWHSHVVVVHGGHWHAPVGRYPYARPRPGYRPPVNIYAPRHNNININNSRNVNINNTKVSRQNVNTTKRTPRPTTTSAALQRAGRATPSPVPTNRSKSVDNARRGRAQTSSAGKASPARQMNRGSSTSAFSGYQRGSSATAASKRGRSSAQSRTTSGRRRQ
jgi:hypothetical protein